MKQPLTAADYHKWSTMEVEQISDYGNWTSYSLRYENETDTLFIKNTKNLKSYSFAGSSMGTFAGERFFICKNQDESLIVTNLDNGRQETMADVKSFTLLKDNTTLFVYRQRNTENKELLIKDLKGKKDILLSNVSIYSYNAESNALVYSSDKKLQLLYLDRPLQKSIVIDSTICDYSDFQWQRNGASFVYFANDTSTKLRYYRLTEQHLYAFDPKDFLNFPKEVELYNSSFTALTISDDGNHIFFGLKSTATPTKSTGVQIWNIADKMLYPNREVLNGWENLPKIGYWFPYESRFEMLTNNDLPQVMLTGDQKFALLYNPVTNEPQFDYNAPIDFYLKNLESGKQKIIIEGQSPDVKKLSVSPSGRFVAFFKDKQWQLYNIITEKVFTITTALGVSFEDENYNRLGEFAVCGIAGWTEKDEAILIYDTYDVWLFKTDGSDSKRLTNGREQHIVYRIVPKTEVNQPSINFTWMRKGVFHLKEGLLLSAVSDSKSGYFKWDKSKRLKEIVSTEKRISDMKISKFNGVCVYSEEHYHQSPILKVKSINSSRAKELYCSNQQQHNYYWGFSKQFTYVNQKGQVAKAALFYPADYNPEKTYPMIVHIYERLSAYYNQYKNPSLYNSIGFNTSNYTTKGYFVLTPDILYEEGNTGMSALDCVTSSCKVVLEHEPVDPKRIGLIGHSFGGYETNFIVTQTNAFATAISGAGISDFVSDYLYYGRNTSRTNFWRYEYDQFRLGASLFDNREIYQRNSPINFVEKVETPVLLWAGENDKQVDYYQSMEFHLALRRLQKPNVLILYDGEHHSLSQKANQLDLTKRMEEWFDFYLKNGDKPDWLLQDKL